MGRGLIMTKFFVGVLKNRIVGMVLSECVIGRCCWNFHVEFSNLR